VSGLRKWLRITAVLNTCTAPLLHLQPEAPAQQSKQLLAIQWLQCRRNTS
jgi:hypothetical protein